jgi:hypothetical protein
MLFKNPLLAIVLYLKINPTQSFQSNVLPAAIQPNYFFGRSVPVILEIPNSIHECESPGGSNLLCGLNKKNERG